MTAPITPPADPLDLLRTRSYIVLLAFGALIGAPVAAVAAGPVAAAEEEVEEKTEFDVVIKSAGPKKIEVIKVIRQLTTLGLVEAKNMAEAPDSKVLEAVTKEVANDAKAKLEAAGAEVALL